MAAISKEEYLKRYLSGDTGGDKKKKRKIKTKASNVRIIDDDVDLKTIDPSASKGKESDEDAPTVAEVIDERPEHVKRLEEYRKDQRWKVLGADGGQDDLASKDYGVITPGNKANAMTVKSHKLKRHDSDSDLLPTRGRQRHDSDSDASLPRKSTRHDSDSDASPSRRIRHGSDSDSAPPRRGQGLKDTGGDARRKRHDSDGDMSPPRKRKADSDADNSLPSKREDDDRPPPRQKRCDSDSSLSRHGPKNNQSPVRKRRHDSGSDQSPPRKQSRNGDQSPVRRKRHDSGDADQSPPRKGNPSDQSPPRKRKDDHSSPPRRRKLGGDSSPTRRRKPGEDQSPSRRSGKDSNRNTAKPEKTLGGAKAGLSSAAEMRKEAEKLKQKEDQMFAKIDRDALGKEAKTVFRDKSGKRRNLQAEKEADEEEAKKKAELDKKYQAWGQGLKQQEMREEKMENYVHEASKPLARYKDDDDLDQLMREMDREGDPMAMFMKKKKEKQEDPNAKPRYRGPAPPPNRFGIMPGYRWDGVDRSNGFEKQIFSKMSEKKAVKEHAYKWSTEDM